MKKTIQFYKILLLILLSFFSFFINYYYGNIGVFPIDTFAFFDTSYNILIDRHPFKDIWITTGFLVDYIQAFFFNIFGKKEHYWKTKFLQIGRDRGFIRSSDKDNTGLSYKLSDIQKIKTQKKHTEVFTFSMHNQCFMMQNKYAIYSVR